jgi:hypothetical protein
MNAHMKLYSNSGRLLGEATTPVDSRRVAEDVTMKIKAAGCAALLVSECGGVLYKDAVGMGGIFDVRLTSLNLMPGENVVFTRLEFIEKPRVFE